MAAVARAAALAHGGALLLGDQARWVRGLGRDGVLRRCCCGLCRGAEGWTGHARPLHCTFQQSALPFTELQPAQPALYTARASRARSPSQSCSQPNHPALLPLPRTVPLQACCRTSLPAPS